MKITQVHTSYRQPGGEDGVVDAEASLLRDAGHTVGQIRFKNPDRLLSTLATLAAAPWNLASAAAARNTSVPDVFHVHNTWFQAGPVVIRTIHRIAPVVITLHNYRIACANALLYREGKPCLDCVGNGGWAGIVHSCYRGSAAASTIVSLTSAVHRWSGTWEREVDRVIAHNDFASAIFQQSGVSPDIIRIADNFVVDPGPRQVRPSQSDVTMAVSRLSREKGLDRLIRAWNASSTNLRLVIVGDGPERPRLEALADSRVSFTGRLPADEVSKRMLRARALMFPSRWFESQPLVVLESLAAGLVPVSSDHPPLRWVLHSLGEGALVPDSDEGWREAIDRVESDSWVDVIGAAARRLFEARFSPQQAIARLEQVYAMAIKHHQNEHHR